MLASVRGPSGATRQPLVEAPPRWSPEGWYDYQFGVHELNLPTSVPAVRIGPAEDAEFALVEDGSLLLFCYRFGEAIPWSVATDRGSLDASRSSCLPPRAGRFEERALLCVTFAPERRDREAFRRNYTLSLDFTRALHDAIREHAGSHLALKERAMALGKLTRRCPSIQRLVARSKVRTIGRP